MDYITDGEVEWQRQPGGVDQFHYPGLSFRQGDDFGEFRKELEAAFQEQRRGLTRYFHDLHRAQKAQRLLFAASVMPTLLARAMSGLADWRYGDLMSTTQAWMDRHIGDPKLQGVLTSQWGDYGLPPERSAFLTHATIVNHFSRGAWYPIGGARQLAKAIIPVIEAAGGRVQTHTSVDRIQVSEGRVTGVIAHRFRRSGDIEEHYRAPLLFSTAGAHTTYHRLLADQPLSEQRRQSERLMAQGSSAATLYLGLKEDPASLGVSGGNHWLYRGFDHNRGFDQGSDFLAGKGRPSGAFLSFPSMKDPEAKAHTAEVVVHCPYAPLAAWASGPGANAELTTMPSRSV